MKQNFFSYIVSEDKESGNALDECLWLRVPHEATVKMSAEATAEDQHSRHLTHSAI